MRRFCKVAMLPLLLVGCASVRPAAELPTPTLDSDRIEISILVSSGIPSPGSKFDWVLIKGGPCEGSRGHVYSELAQRTGQAKDRYVLTPETFEECRKLLIETKFLQMKSPEPIGFQFEPGCVSIRVKCSGLTHSVDCVGNAKQSPEFVRLRTFLDELPNRAKVVNSPP